MNPAIFSVSLIAALAAFPAAAQVPDDLQLVQVQTGFTGLTAVRFPDDGSHRMFAIEQAGRVRISDAGVIRNTPFIHLCNPPADDCFIPVGGFTSGGERGLLGIAFHPEFPDDPRVFLNYTNGGGNTVVASVTPQAGDANNLADTSQFIQLLVIDQDFTNHNGGDIHFGPDGYLYIAMGDGGSGGDPCSRAQTMRPDDLVSGCPATPSRALLGKMLRIDVDTSTPAGSNNLCGAATNGSAPYAIPEGNPYAGDATGICAEIWAAGLRNPWRFSFDRDNGDLWIGDVGQESREEVNRAALGSTGLNYGWRCREGLQSYSSTGPFCNDPTLIATFTPPVFDYARASGRCAITGGYRYRGPAPSLHGIYFFGDYCEGRLLLARESEGGSWSFISDPRPGSNISNIRAFSEDSEGNVYVVNNNVVFRITGDVPIPQEPEIFEDGFEATP